MRVLVVSLSTYSAPYNDGKLRELGPRLEDLTVVSGDLGTLWGSENETRSGAGYKVVILPLDSEGNYATVRLVGLDEIVDAARPTLIHVECEPWQAVAVQSLRSAKRLGVPIGVQFAECGPRLRGLRGVLRRVRGAWVLRRCDYAVGWATASTRIAQRLAPGIRTETFPATGVTLAVAPASADEWFGAGSAAVPKLAFVGRFAEEKGIDEFLALADHLAGRMPVRVSLAGGGGNDEQVGEWVAQRPWASLQGIIPRTAVSSMLSVADVLVCPSRTTRKDEEQFGKAAVEAMAVGTPVFAYDCGALAEVIGAGGVVVPEGDRAQLGLALEELFGASAAERAALEDSARQQAAKFTDDAIAGQLVDLWSSCERSA